MLLIRDAQLYDCEAIQSVAHKTWHHTYEGLIPHEIQNNFLQSAYSDKAMHHRITNTHLVVAQWDQVVVGFANVFVNEQGAELGAIYIYPEFQGKGIGSELLKVSIEKISNEAQLLVSVEAENRVGINFYKAKGFTLIEELDEDFAGHLLKTKRMMLKI